MRSPVDTGLRQTIWRIGVQTALLLTVSLVVVGAVVYATVVRSQDQLVTQTLEQAMSKVRDRGYFDHDNDAGGPGASVRTAALSADGLRVSANMPAGLPDRGVMEQVQGDGRPDRRVVRVASGEYVLLTEKRGDQVAQITYSLFEQHQERERILRALGLAGGVGVALSTLLGAWLARRAVQPMAEALILQRRFVADAGHELRTPLTLLSTRAQLLRRRLSAQPAAPAPAAPTELEQQIIRDADGIVADTKTLAKIMEDLLLAADTRTPVLDERVNLTFLASEAVAAAQASAEQRSILLTFTSDGTEALTAGTPAALTRAVTGLIDNALSHAVSRVDVAVIRRGSGISICVTDDGPGIAEAVLPRMFERFSGDRGGQTDAAGRRHYGLGLALVNEIAVRHGGTVTAENAPSPGHGAILTITVPAR